MRWVSGLTGTSLALCCKSGLLTFHADVAGITTSGMFAGHLYSVTVYIMANPSGIAAMLAHWFDSKGLNVTSYAVFAE